MLLLEKIRDEPRDDHTVSVYQVRKSAGGEAESIPSTDFGLEALDTLLEHPVWQEAIQKMAPDRIECIVDAVGGVHLRLVMRQPPSTDYDRIKLE